MRPEGATSQKVRNNSKITPNVCKWWIETSIKETKNSL